MKDLKKQAAEYFRRLANGKIPEIEVTVNYSEPKSEENEGWSLLMVKKYIRNLERASSSIVNSPRSAL